MVDRIGRRVLLADGFRIMGGAGMTDSPVTGFTMYKDRMVLQREGYRDLFERFLPWTRPDRIVEIGTASGGLTHAIVDLLDEKQINCRLRSYDIGWSKGVASLMREGVDLRCENLFSDDYTAFNPRNTRGVVDLIEFIRQPGITVVMCDGGNKISEFNLLAGTLKPGDFIMAHDFAWNEHIFKSEIEGKIWNWMQITFDDVAYAAREHNLKPYWTKQFEQYAWLCMRKKDHDY